MYHYIHVYVFNCYKVLVIDLLDTWILRSVFIFVIQRKAQQTFNQIILINQVFSIKAKRQYIHIPITGEYLTI